MQLSLRRPSCDALAWKQLSIVWCTTHVRHQVQGLSTPLEAACRAFQISFPRFGFEVRDKKQVVFELHISACARGHAARTHTYLVLQQLPREFHVQPHRLQVCSCS